MGRLSLIRRIFRRPERRPSRSRSKGKKQTGKAGGAQHALPSPMASMQAVKPAYDGNSLAVYHWTPPPEFAFPNFGDELSPLLVQRMLDRARGNTAVVTPQTGRAKLLAVGSIMHLARNGDIVWGAGVNAKTWIRNLDTNKLIDVRLVRGPLTQAALAACDIACPTIFGDPALAFPTLFHKEIQSMDEAGSAKFPDARVLYIPNLNDERFGDQRLARADPRISYISPSEHPFLIANIISRAELVLSSSLHGLVLADAFGVPSRPILSLFEPLYKYIDYYEGTGRRGVKFAGDYGEALFFGDIPEARFDVENILASFPYDLVSSKPAHT